MNLWLNKLVQVMGVNVVTEDQSWLILRRCFIQNVGLLLQEDLELRAFSKEESKIGIGQGAFFVIFILSIIIVASSTYHTWQKKWGLLSQ